MLDQEKLINSFKNIIHKSTALDVGGLVLYKRTDGTFQTAGTGKILALKADNLLKAYQDGEKITGYDRKYKIIAEIKGMKGRGKSV